jgi:hypothetical protein
MTTKPPEAGFYVNHDHPQGRTEREFEVYEHAQAAYNYLVALAISDSWRKIDRVALGNRQTREDMEVWGE